MISASTVAGLLLWDATTKRNEHEEINRKTIGNSTVDGTRPLNSDSVAAPAPRIIRGSKPDEVAPSTPFSDALNNTVSTASERVDVLRGLRGENFTDDEHTAAFAFLKGNSAFFSLPPASRAWVADELLTVLRLESPTSPHLVENLAKVALDTGVELAVRDYAIQHLGHLWEQIGPNETIEESLWSALDTNNSIAGGSAIIALNNGFIRDGNHIGLEALRGITKAALFDDSKALELKVTALSIFHVGDDPEIDALSSKLADGEEVPVILRKVAERMVR